MTDEFFPTSKARRYIEGDMDVGQEEALTSVADLEFDLRMPYEIKIADLEAKVAQRDKLIKELKECPVCDAAIKDLTVKLRLAMHGLRKIAAGGLTSDGRAWAPRDYREFARETINQQ